MRHAAASGNCRCVTTLLLLLLLLLLRVCL
eukprot:COSAG06_NODE_32485_length_505_cov_1.098522_1_plen_29_part_01